MFPSVAQGVPKISRRRAAVTVVVSRAIFCEVTAGYHLYTSRLVVQGDGGTGGAITSGDKEKTLTDTD